MGELCVGGLSEVKDGSGDVAYGFGESGEIPGRGLGGGAAARFGVFFKTVSFGMEPAHCLAGFVANGFHLCDMLRHRNSRGFNKGKRDV